MVVFLPDTKGGKIYMGNKVTFRNAERKDTGLILQFVKELADW